MSHGDKSTIRHRDLSTYRISSRPPAQRARPRITFSPGGFTPASLRLEEGNAGVPLDAQRGKRQVGAKGVLRARISRKLGASRNTVTKYAEMRDGRRAHARTHNIYVLRPETFRCSNGGGTGNPYQTMTFGGWRVFP